MKSFSTFRHLRHASGFSLIEISLVMALMIGLSVGIGTGIVSMQRWKKGKDAALSLQAAYAAQRAYMADHPTANIATVTATQLQGYLPQGWSTLPSGTGLDGEALTLDHAVMPPKWLVGTSAYDPSGKSDDGLWDVGE